MNLASIKLVISVLAILVAGWIARSYWAHGEVTLPFSGYTLKDWFLFIILFPIVFLILNARALDSSGEEEGDKNKPKE